MARLKGTLNLATGDMVIGNDTEASNAIVRVRGDLRKLQLTYTDVGSAVVVKIQEQIEDGTWKDRWQSPSTNTDDWYLPTKTSTLADGTAGNAEGPIPLDEPLGYRVVRVSGAASGTVGFYLSFDQR